MTEHKPDKLLARKLRGRATPELPVGNAVAKALSIAFAKVGEDIGGMVSVASSCQDDIVGQAGLIAAAAKTSLICVLARENAALGMVTADLNVVASVLEYLTTDRVTAHAPDERAPTRTDAAVVGDFIDQFLRWFDKELAYLDHPPDFREFRCARPLADARAIRMTMEEMSYQKYALGVDLGENGRSGLIELYFPLEAPRDARSPDDKASWSAIWRSNAKTFPTEIDAVLHRFLMPLSEILSLEPGKILRVPKSQISMVSLEAANNRIAARGKLGRSGAFRAVKLQLGTTSEMNAEILDAEPDQAQNTKRAKSPPTPVLPAIEGLGDEDDAVAGIDPALAFDTEMAELDLDIGLGGGGDFPAMGDLPPLDDM